MAATADGSFDIAICGAGPAGAFAAALLARRGARVALLGAEPGVPRLEGLSERAGQILAAHGFRPPPGAVSPPLPRRAHWGGQAQAANTERLVDRQRLDGALSAFALGAGATRIVGPIAALEADAVRLADGRQVRASRLVEARGARAPRPAGAAKGPPLLGIGRAFRRSQSTLGLDVVPLAEGWLWAASADGHALWVQAALDPGTLAGPGDAGLSQTLESLLASEPARAALGAPGEAATPAIARDATPMLCAPDLDPARPRIGDAAARFDPLSGHGLFFALSSALALLPILAALEEGPDGAERARAFYRQRIGETFWRQARVGRDFYRMEPRFAEGAFWAARRHWPDDLPAHATLTRPAIRSGIAVSEGTLVDAELLVTPQEPAGIAFLAGVPLVPLLRKIQDGDVVADWDRFRQCCGPKVAPDAARTCFDWLAARGLLQPGAIETGTKEDGKGDGRR